MIEKSNLNLIYGSIKYQMRELISHINYITYIEELTPVEVDGNVIVLETPSDNIAKHITNTLAEKMRAAIINTHVGLYDFRLVESTVINKKCPECNKEILPEWKFCPECGTRIIDGAFK